MFSNKNNNLIKLFLLILFVFSLSACATSNKWQYNEIGLKNGNKPKVVSTIFPLYDLVRQIGGEEVEAVLLLTPGSSPHTFELSPGQVKKLQNADLFLSIGAGLDDWVLDLQANFSQAEIIDLSTVVNLRFFNSGSPDPHYWLNPDNIRLLTLDILRLLSELRPDLSQYYETRAYDFMQSLAEAELSWHDDLSTLQYRDIIVFHDAWHYFADYFNFNILATVEEFPGKSPSPKYLSDLQLKIKQLNKAVIFIEPQLSSEVVSALAQDLGLEVFSLDPLGGTEGRLSYLDLLTYNITTLIQALQL